MRIYTYNLRSLLRPLAFALSIALLTSSLVLLGMEGSGMMIASRNGMVVSGGGGAWTNPYVTNGLIAMWDAEWNVGGGHHESNPQTWVDLSGNKIDMISNGSPVFFDKYIQPTQLSEMFHTEVTDKCDSMLANAVLSMEIVGLAVVGFTAPKFCLFGGSTSREGFNVTAASGDPTRVGVSARVGTVSVNIYSSQSPFGYFAMTSDGTTVTGYYKSGSGELSRTASAVAPITNYVSKRFAIGYRYGYYPDGPMMNGERVYCVRVYDRALTVDEINANYKVDAKRFNLTEGGGA